jgi:hypothetical protein
MKTKLCIQCPIRTVLDPQDFTSCRSCPSEKPRYDKEKRECTECPDGTFADWTDISKCINCPV